MHNSFLLFLLSSKSTPKRVKILLLEPLLHRCCCRCCCHTHKHTHSLSHTHTHTQHTPKTHTDAHCLKNRDEGNILCLAYAFLNMVVLALKSFLTFKFLFSIDIIKFQTVFKNNEKLSILEFAKLPPLITHCGTHLHMLLVDVVPKVCELSVAVRTLVCLGLAALLTGQLTHYGASCIANSVQFFSLKCFISQREIQI